MKVAVTGASGFVGRHVAAALVARGVRPVLASRNPDDLADFRSCAEIVGIDLHALPNDPFAVLGGPDVLIHLAWQGLPNYQSLHHLDDELPAQMGFLKRLVTSGLRGLSVTGTCLEYGTTSGLKSESMTAAPSTPYGTAKDTLRQYLEDLARQHPVAWTWHRLFYLHGPGQAATSLLPQLHRAITDGLSAFPMSGGEQIRDFYPVEQAAENIVALALKQRPFGVVNGCSGNPVSVRTFVERHLADCGLAIALDLGHFPYSDYEPFAFWGDVSYLNQCLES